MPLTRNAKPGGSDTQVQFNDAGAFGGDAGLTYDKDAPRLSSGPLPDDAGFDPTIRDFFGSTGQINASATARSGGQTAGVTVIQQGAVAGGLEGIAIIAANQADGGRQTALDLDAIYLGSGTSPSAVGIAVEAWNANDGTITDVKSLLVLAPANAGSGHIDNGISVEIHQALDAQTDHLTGLLIQAIHGALSGAALHIEDQGAAATDYAIQSDGGRISLDGAVGIFLPNLPTVNPHVVGQLWSNGGVLSVSAGP